MAYNNSNVMNPHFAIFVLKTYKKYDIITQTPLLRFVVCCGTLTVQTIAFLLYIAHDLILSAHYKHAMKKMMIKLYRIL